MASKQSNPIVDIQRLDRIETKIDKLAEAIVSIARAEEKLVSLENDKKFLMLYSRLNYSNKLLYKIS